MQGVQGPVGPQGIPGNDGVDGADGKSAYQSALDGGYTGTESKFNSDLAAVSNKADKVSNVTSGNFAALNSNGNLSDSGKKPADFAPAPLSSNLTLYVNGSTGSDSNPGTQSAPFATITAALNAIPKNLGGYTATINIAAGTYNEEITIRGFCGGGVGNLKAITFIGSGTSTVISGSIAINDNISIYINNLEVNGYIVAYNSGFLHLGSLTVTSATTFAINSVGTTLACYNVTVNNSNGNGIVIGAATAFLFSTSGQVSGIGIIAGRDSDGLPGLVVTNSSNITATTKYSKVRGGAIIENGVLV